MKQAARRALGAETVQELKLAVDEVLAVLEGRPVPPREEPPEA
jgi:hypothetical protein